MNEIRNDEATQVALDDALLKACATGEPEEVKELLAWGANPNAPHWGGLMEYSDEDYYCIHEAARNPDLRVLETLIEAGVDPETSDYWWRKPLAYAARDNSLEMVRRLVDLGNDPAWIDMVGGSVLSWAAANPDRRVVEFLMDHGAELDCTDSVRSELGMALLHGTPGRVRWFLERGSKMENLWPGLCKEAPIENLRVLLEHGFDTNPPIYDSRAPGQKYLMEGLDPERRALFADFAARRKTETGMEVVR